MELFFIILILTSIAALLLGEPLERFAQRMKKAPAKKAGAKVIIKNNNESWRRAG